jgi:hypothetical protein
MPSIRCPSCGRALNFTDALRGALVQCPACRHNFVAPEEEPRPPRPPPAPVAAHPTPPAGPEPFDFAGPEDARAARQRKALHSAAWWLRCAVVLDVGASVLGCCTLPVLTAEFPAGLFFLAGTGVAQYLPLILVAVGSQRLRERRGYRLCQAAAVLVLPPSLWALLQTVVAARVALGELGGAEPAGMFFLPLAALTVCGAAAGVVGAAKAIALLSDAEVRRSFR